ncbi:retroviral-like aspartic protease family protein [bacterium]|nr:retroviral-like aspartic protease family protein [bacterium]
MKRLFYSTLILLLFSILADAQTVIKMKKESGVYHIPCKVNDIPLKMIFDTGASNMCISAAEALVMMRSGSVTEDDIIGDTRYQTASGEIE